MSVLHLRKQLYLKFCVVCLTERREMVFVHPNGVEHALCCADCANELRRHQQPCPICRQPLLRRSLVSKRIASQPERLDETPVGRPVVPTVAAVEHDSTITPAWEQVARAPNGRARGSVCATAPDECARPEDGLMCVCACMDSQHTVGAWSRAPSSQNTDEPERCTCHHARV